MAENVNSSDDQVCVFWDWFILMSVRHGDGNDVDSKSFGVKSRRFDVETGWDEHTELGQRAQ